MTETPVILNLLFVRSLTTARTESNLKYVLRKKSQQFLLDVLELPQSLIYSALQK